MVQRYEGYGFFLWYNAPMHDRSKQIIPRLLNGLNKENEVCILKKGSMHVLVHDHSMDNLFGCSIHHATKKWC